MSIYTRYSRLVRIATSLGSLPDAEVPYITGINIPIRLLLPYETGVSYVGASTMDEDGFKRIQDMNSKQINSLMI